MPSRFKGLIQCPDKAWFEEKKRKRSNANDAKGAKKKKEDVNHVATG